MTDKGKAEMFRQAKLLLVGSCLLAIAACSSGPSDAEVETAIKARIGDMDSGADAPSVTSAKNNGCRSTGGGTYACEVEVAIAMPGVGNLTNIAQLRMVKSGDGWTYEKNQPLSMQSK